MFVSSKIMKILETNVKTDCLSKEIRYMKDQMEISELKSTITKNNPKTNQTLVAGPNSKMKRPRRKNQLN